MYVARLRAHAKINWFLDITGRRADGYHTLSTLMQKVSLADIISVSQEAIVSESKAFALGRLHLYLSIDGFDLRPDRRNTVVKAVELFLTQGTLPISSLYIHIEKHIPVEGGMGGGSADAACILRYLNTISETSMAESELQALALKVGADVPFCLHEAPLALCTGIGEEITPIEGPEDPIALLLLLPGLRVSTAVAFGRYDNLTESALAKIQVSNPSEFITALQTLDTDGLNRAGQNTFYELLKTDTSMSEIMPALQATGAIYRTMTGSGPTFVAAFASKEARDRAISVLSTTGGGTWRTVACETLP